MKIKIHYERPPKSHLKKYWLSLCIFLLAILLIRYLFINPLSSEEKGGLLFASFLIFIIFFLSIYIFEGYRFESYLAKNHPEKWAKLNKGGTFFEEFFSRQYFNKKTREFINSNNNLNDKNLNGLKSQQFMLKFFYVIAFVLTFIVLIVINK